MGLILVATFDSQCRHHDSLSQTRSLDNMFPQILPRRKSYQGKSANAYKALLSLLETQTCLSSST